MEEPLLELDDELLLEAVDPLLELEEPPELTEPDDPPADEEKPLVEPEGALLELELELDDRLLIDPEELSLDPDPPEVPDDPASRTPAARPASPWFRCRPWELVGALPREPPPCPDAALGCVSFMVAKAGREARCCPPATSITMDFTSPPGRVKSFF